MNSTIRKTGSWPRLRDTVANGNGRKTFGDRYTTIMIGVFCTLGSVVYVTELPRQFVHQSQVAALNTQVHENTVATRAAVKTVNQARYDSKQAAGSAAAAQVSAREAAISADAAEKAARQRFQNESTKRQLQDLFERSASNRRSISILQKQFDDFRKAR